MGSRWSTSRAVALAPQLILAGLGWVQSLLLVVATLMENARRSEGIVFTPILAFATLLVGIPTLVYTSMLIRWWRTGRWRALAIADAVIAALAAWGLVGSLTSGGNSVIPALIATTAVLGFLALIETRPKP